MTKKPKGLGRGLNALFEDEENTRFEDGGQKEIGTGRTVLGIDQLEASMAQPRRIFDIESINELAESIKQHGILQPLLVRRSREAPSRYEIIAGERRWRAAQKAMVHDIPVIIREMSDEDAMEIALIENLQREDLNPVDEAMSYKRLMEDHKYTQEKLAQKLGKSRSYIANMVRLLGLSDVVLGYLERGDLSIGHARTLVTMKDDQERLAREIVERKLSVRDTEKFVSEASNGNEDTNTKPAGKTKTTYTKDTDTLALEQDISNKIGMRTHINSKNGKSGQVVIEFASLDQLDSILKRLDQ